ncbi:hypothetical protein QYE76_059432 [Lolium multiflorum]|uniref:Integrase zinc-binding domain-containing protein n=1 Tax=Lolium multiflorum TaxID=4521 RepID=A0AAD8W5H9_LOLMU|nr:hypothetical protein QYE76_059432 [Lolium multiflorum]
MMQATQQWKEAVTIETLSETDLEKGTCRHKMPGIGWTRFTCPRSLKLKESRAGGLMGHFGHEKTLLMLDDHFYWPKMRRDVDRYVKRCITCNKSKSKLKPHGTKREEASHKEKRSSWT